MSLSLRFAAGSHTGMIRDHNEDSGYAGPRLLAIADGMGGQAAGEVASSEVISTLVPLDDDVPGSDLLTSLDGSVQRANEQLRAMVAEDPRLDGMGTTLTALLWTGQRLGVVHVGDSRAYLLRDGQITQITQDHTWVQRLVDEGRISEEEATTHPQRSLLMRALGSADHIEADLSIREVRAGDRYLLCSDGLSGVVSQDTLRDALAGFASPQETVRELIELALRGGGPDNITCIVADVLNTDTQEGDTLARQFYDAPQVVGAVADTQAQRFGNGQTPAARAAELARSPAPGPGADLAGQPPGTYGTFGDSEYVSLAPRGRAWKRTVLIILALVVLVGGLYAGYRWTQRQYYIAANGDHVALYQGLSDSLGPLTLHSIKQDYPEVELRYLPEVQRVSVEETIAAASLDEAHSTIDDLAEQVEVCKIVEQQEEEEQAEEDEQQDQQGQQNGDGDGQNGDSSGSTSPPLTDEQRDLAKQCGT